MLTRLELTNFRQHTSLKLEFTQGVTVIRGANECGKSTIFEAVTFALFGVEACRSNDLTTWGAPDKSHVVTLELDLKGQTYHIVRSARGAELNSGDIKITGQREVTRRCEQLLDLKPGTGTNLMFTSQNSVRGTLDEGSKSIQLIEKLADFDVVDGYINTLQTNFSLGKSDHLQQLVAELETQLVNTQQQIDDFIDIGEFEATENSALDEQLQALKAQAVGKKSDIDRLTEQLDKIRGEEETRNKLKLSIANVEKNLDSIRSGLNAPVSTRPNAHLVADAESRVKFHEQLKNIRAQADIQKKLGILHLDYLSYSYYCPSHFDSKNPLIRINGTKESIQQDIGLLESNYSEYRIRKQELLLKRKNLEDQKCTNLVCPTCKREWDNADEMQKNNARISEEIVELNIELAKLDNSIVEVESEINKLKVVLRQPEFTPAINSKWVIDDDGKYPLKYKWAGGELAEVDHEVSRQLEVYEDLLEDLSAWESKQEVFKQQLVDAETQLAELTENLALVPESDTSSAELSHTLNQVRLDLNDIQHGINSVNSKKSEIPVKVEQLRKQYSELKTEENNVKDKINNFKNEIINTQINNALLKALREIKPILANTIWQQVCNTISQYFSTMRDTPSMVTKASTGFEVDGHNTKALSGSTLDVLGIAIRVALTKTFLPTCGFMLLDEPFAACDVERQMRALGFITSTGFDQIIIVTHEDTTEAVADNLITL